MAKEISTIQSEIKHHTNDDGKGNKGVLFHSGISFTS